MPTSPVPFKLISKLRSLAKQKEKRAGHPEDLYRFFTRLPGIDHRGKTRTEPGAAITAGERVRQLQVSRRHPNLELALKHTHAGFTAQKTIEGIRAMVQKHNIEHRPGDYELKMPFLYAVAPRIIAMVKTNCPSLDEILLEKTKRGIDFFEKIRATHNVTEGQLRKARDALLQRTGLKPDNVLLADFKNGKFIFFPIGDLHKDYSPMAPAQQKIK
ncbi:MAG: hypothetical protein PHD95_06925 [Candidatus ainarchaeum sp.]|nr:hypothetical protein [Candidatus ainarchaeum sp.]